MPTWFYRSGGEFTYKGRGNLQSGHPRRGVPLPELCSGVSLRLQTSFNSILLWRAIEGHYSARQAQASMRLFVGVTDWDWWSLHASKPSVEEANFWRPSPTASFQALATVNKCCNSMARIELSQPAFSAKRLSART
jgi:hypothetical protein